MKTEFVLTLFDDEKTRKKLEMLNCLEAMFDDERNELPNDYFFFSDELPIGSVVKITMEVVSN